MARDFSIYKIISNIRDAAGELSRAGSAPLEVAFAIPTIGAGVWSGWPFYMTYLSMTPAYEALTRILSPNALAMIFTALGLLQLMAFFILRNRNLRIMACVGCFFIWFVASFVLLSDVVPGWLTLFAPITSVFELVCAVVLIHRGQWVWCPSSIAIQTDGIESLQN